MEKVVACLGADSSVGRWRARDGIRHALGLIRSWPLMRAEARVGRWY